ncbi:hypothetical protein VM1G_02579 [Cytospora mali]|uniref:Uncharacterized protein n=1 Tax=Cytospora mali TaxID=578113 RepID=A0A194VSG2_CYTMA|nr:hypothetical protein VM1G_02579 [Valsa mali]
MRLTALLSLALPAVALAQNATTTSSATPSATPDYEAICESQAYGYADYCPQCLSQCEGSAYAEQCYYSVFTAINEIESDCEAHSGWNCEQTAVDDVCTDS